MFAGGSSATPTYLTVEKATFSHRHTSNRSSSTGILHCSSNGSTKTASTSTAVLSSVARGQGRCSVGTICQSDDDWNRRQTSDDSHRQQELNTSRWASFGPAVDLSRASNEKTEMSSTPTDNHLRHFPFAVNCKLTKTFFGVPRKCSKCDRMIVLTAGYACQFCRYRCHRHCVGDRQFGRPKPCSLSRLPIGDEKLVGKLLRENEINSNVYPGDWASVLNGNVGDRLRSAGARCGSTEANSSSNPFSSSSYADSQALSTSASACCSIETLTSVEPQSPISCDGAIAGSSDLDVVTFPEEDVLGSSAFSQLIDHGALSSDENQNGDVISGSCTDSTPPADTDTAEIEGLPGSEPRTVIDRLLRLFYWTRDPADGNTTSPPFGRLSDYRREMSSPVKTPVDEFNNSVIEQLFHKRSRASSYCSGLGGGDARLSPSSTAASSATPSVVNKRLNWVRHIVGDRVAQSQDCVIDVDDVDIDGGGFPPWRPSTSNRLGVPSLQPCRLSSSWPLLGLHLNHEDDYSCDYPNDVVPPRFELGYSETEDEDSSPFQPPLLSSVDRDVTHGGSFGEWAINFDALEVGDTVREGANASTYKGRWHGEVMIHRYHCAENDDTAMEKFLADVHALTKIRHENIALFMGACMEPPNLLIVTSIRRGDSLHSVIHETARRLSHQAKVNVAKQIAQGIGYLHAKGIVLRCLTSRSVHLECKVKICTVDYGYHRPTNHDCRNGAFVSPGQLSYLSPELIMGLMVEPPVLRVAARHTKESDVYAFGTVLYEMFAGDYPLADWPTEALLWMTGSGQPRRRRPRSQQRAVPRRCQSSGMRALIDECWTPNAVHRPSFTVILKKLHHTAALHKKHSTSEPERLHQNSRTNSGGGASSAANVGGVATAGGVGQRGGFHFDLTK